MREIGRGKDSVVETPAVTGSVVGTLGLTVLPPFIVLFVEESAWQYLGVGAVSWVAAVALKMVLMSVPCVRAGTKSGAFGAAAWGSFSAVSELAATGLLIATYAPPETLGQVLAVGIGVSSIEIVYVLGIGVREGLRGQDPQALQAWICGALQSGWVRNMLFIERLSATLGHIGSRGLVYVSVTTGQNWPALLGLILFASVDSVAVYGRGQMWDWCAPQIARRFYAFCLSVGALETAAFVVSFPWR